MIPILSEMSRQKFYPLHSQNFISFSTSTWSPLESKLFIPRVILVACSLLPGFHHRRAHWPAALDGNHHLDWLISRNRSQFDSQSRGTAAMFICFAAQCAIQFSSRARSIPPADRTARLPAFCRLSAVFPAQRVLISGLVRSPYRSSVAALFIRCLLEVSGSSRLF